MRWNGRGELVCPAFAGQSLESRLAAQRSVRRACRWSDDDRTRAQGPARYGHPLRGPGRVRRGEQLASGSVPWQVDTSRGLRPGRQLGAPGMESPNRWFAQAGLSFMKLLRWSSRRPGTSCASAQLWEAILPSRSEPSIPRQKWFSHSKGAFRHFVRFRLVSLQAKRSSTLQAGSAVALRSSCAARRPKARQFASR
jgi:hypothetical protein